MIKGRVIKSTGSWYTVLTSEGKIFNCRIKGNIRLKELRTTNPVTVGDIVHTTPEPNSSNAVIEEIEERKNYIIRKSINLSKKYHILASNVDHVYIMATVNNPRTPYGFIDRMMVTAEAYHIPATLLINKIDTWNAKDLKLATEMTAIYTDVGYRVIPISATSSSAVAQLKEVLKNKVNLIIGHSGTGKSTLINSLNTKLFIKTAETSEAHLQGKHTTTFAEMHPIDENTFIIDTPGIREFGLIDMNKYEIGDYFPEIRDRKNQCKFNNCLHVNEPGCMVKLALNENKIPFTRYRSYVSMLEGETEADYDI